MMEKEGYLLVTGSVSCDLESTLESMRRAKVELRGAPGLAVVVDIRRAAYHPMPEEAKELAGGRGRRCSWTTSPGWRGRSMASFLPTSRIRSDSAEKKEKQTQRRGERRGR
jgi:hypothetical protein